MNTGQTEATACTGKQVFEGKRAALKLLQLRRRRKKTSRCKAKTLREDLQPYKCPFCQRWHLGNR